MPVQVNEAPPVETFCATAAAVQLPVIRFPGGLVLEPQIDPTRGAPGPCELVLDLTGKLQGALAPFMPLFRILDAVTHLANCVLLLKDCITNPFKIPDLVACLPGLLGKLNALLALIPVFPQGIADMITFVVDVIRFVIAMLDCVLAQLSALQAELAELGRLTYQLNATEDELARANLEEMIACGTETANANADSILAALGPIARLLCTVRSLLALVPGADGVARSLAFPDPSSVANIGAAITALSSIRDALSAAISVVEAIGAPFGVPLPAPESGFSCPLDEPASSTTVAELPEPSISGITNAAGAAIPPATITQATPGGPAFRIIISGEGFTADSQVFWNTAQVEADAIQFVSPETLIVDLPAELLTNTGMFYVMIVNVPAGGVEQFAGLSETPGQPATDTGVETSEQFEVEVA